MLLKMHVNDKELISTSLNRPATIEGRINYKKISSAKSKGSFKEYWFKLTGNLLYYFSLNSFGGIKGTEPTGVMVLENMTVTLDEEGAGLFSFIITFAGDTEKHVFSCFNVSQVQNWVTALRQASYEHLRIQVRILENRLKSLGGVNIFGWNNGGNLNDVKLGMSPSVPPRNKSVGPKTNTFVSHMASSDSNLKTGSQQDKNANNPSATEDLIKW